MTPALSSPPVALSSHCAGSVRYYAAAVQAGAVAIDDCQTRLPLRHSHHRYVIDGPNGAQQLTVPIVASTATLSTPLRDVRIAEHGNWRRLHWGALFSAYGRSPYFDYIADELEPIIMGRQTFLLDLNMAIHHLVVDFMDLPLHTTLLSALPAAPVGDLDWRAATSLRHGDGLDVRDVPYYQVWNARYGFRPAMSILDMAMNLGREGILTLKEMAL